MLSHYKFSGQTLLAHIATGRIPVEPKKVKKPASKVNTTTLYLNPVGNYLLSGSQEVSEHEKEILENSPEFVTARELFYKKKHALLNKDPIRFEMESEGKLFRAAVTIRNQIIGRNV